MLHQTLVSLQSIDQVFNNLVITFIEVWKSLPHSLRCKCKWEKTNIY